MTALWQRSLIHTVFMGGSEQEQARKRTLMSAFDKGDMETILLMQSQHAFDHGDLVNGLVSSMIYKNPLLEELLWPLFVQIPNNALDREGVYLAENAVEHNRADIFACALSKSTLTQDKMMYHFKMMYHLIQKTSEWGRVEMFDVMMDRCAIHAQWLDRCLEKAAGEGHVEMVRHVMNCMHTTQEDRPLAGAFDAAIEQAFLGFHLECVIVLLDGSSMEADGALRRFGDRGYLKGVKHFLPRVQNPQTIVDAFLSTQYEGIALCLAPHLDVDLLNDTVDSLLLTDAWLLYDFHRSIIGMVRDQQQLNSAVGDHIGRDCIGKRKM